VEATRHTKAEGNTGTHRRMSKNLYFAFSLVSGIDLSTHFIQLVGDGRYAEVRDVHGPPDDFQGISVVLRVLLLVPSLQPSRFPVPVSSKLPFRNLLEDPVGTPILLSDLDRPVREVRIVDIRK
jgi:hypothetical protein